VKIAAVIVIVVALGAGAAWKFSPRSEDPRGVEARGTAMVARQTLKIVLTERGTLKTKNSTQVRSRASAKIEWLIDEGKQVKEGDILVELDKKDTKNTVDQLANQITQLETELKSATTEELIQVDQNKTDIEKAELALAVADVERKKLLEADLPADERKLQLAIEEKKVALKEAEEDVTAYEELLKEDFATQREVDKAQLALKKARNDLKTAEMEWENHQSYEKPLEIRKKEAALEEAKRGLERAKKRAEAQLAAKQAVVQQKNVSLQRIRQQHEQMSKQLEEMTLKAPTEGTVLYGDPDNPWNNENIKVGGQVWHNMVLITLPDSREMNVVVEIHEADIDKVKPDMVAYVTSETQKDKVYEGKVVKIDSVANAGRRWWGGDDVKRFRVEIELVEKELDLKTGTSAKVEIQIGEVPDVLAVPLQAVFAREGKYYCYVAKEGEPVRVEVEPGRSNESYVEVKSGLAEGDEVLLYDPEIATEATEATEVTEATEAAPADGGEG